jgi:hypothetical protein
MESKKASIELLSQKKTLLPKNAVAELNLFLYALILYAQTLFKGLNNPKYRLYLIRINSFYLGK